MKISIPKEAITQIMANYNCSEEEAAKDAMSRKVNDAFKKFKAQVGVWGTVSENAYYNVIADKFSLKV